MSQPTSIRDYYRHIVSRARRGDPTIDEARADYHAPSPLSFPA